MHIDDFIDFGTDRTSVDEVYARWVFNHFRLSANLKYTFAPFMKEHKLFCTYEGEKYRVTGASCLGDVWLTKNFNQDTGYQSRVDVSECSDWSKKERESYKE